MAEELPDTGRVRKQLEFYESEVRRLEQQLAQNNTGFNKQIVELEAKVKDLTEKLETANSNVQPKILEGDKLLTDEVNNHSELITSKD